MPDQHPSRAEAMFILTPKKGRLSEVRKKLAESQSRFRARSKHIGTTRPFAGLSGD